MVDRPSVRVTSDFDHEEEEEGSASTLRSPIDVSFWSRQIFHQPQNPKFVIFLRSVPSWPRKDASLSSMPTEREITLKRMTAPVEYWTITPLTRFSTGTSFLCQSRGHTIKVVLYRGTGWSNLARGELLTLHLDWRAIFQASFVSFHTDALTKDTLCGSIVTEPVSWLWFDDSYFLFRAQPCIKHKRVSHHADNKLQCSVIFS